ncbi:MAG: SIMPL domain-containing protein [Candidatus Eremiobacteraeota bacterium]|nr:SIMPL domain-containing protein [Candidatus Eremiobacteraeota bacterium]
MRQRYLIAVLTACLLPIAAAAQQVHVEQFNKPSGPARGITATESFSEKLPADEATITVGIMSPTANAPTQPQLQQIADSFTKAGFASANVSKQVMGVAGIGPSMSSVSVSAATAATSPAEFPFSMSRVQLRANDCADALDRARVAAIAKTRAKALTIAREIGVKLGAIQALNDQERLSPDNSCTSDFGIGPASSTFMMSSTGQTSPDDYASVIVTSTVTITYAIK